MNMRDVRMAVVISVVAAASAGAAIAAQIRQPEGSQRYTPTRVEWLCVEYNAMARQELEGDNRFWRHATFRGTDPNTVVISIGYLPGTDRDLLELAVKNAREEILALAQVRGWQWVKVAEDIKRIDPR